MTPDRSATLTTLRRKIGDKAKWETAVTPTDEEIVDLWLPEIDAVFTRGIDQSGKEKLVYKPALKPEREDEGLTLTRPDGSKFPTDGMHISTDGILDLIATLIVRDLGRIPPKALLQRVLYVWRVVRPGMRVETVSEEERFEQLFHQCFAPFPDYVLEASDVAGCLKGVGHLPSHELGRWKAWATSKGIQWKHRNYGGVYIGMTFRPSYSLRGGPDPNPGKTYAERVAWEQREKHEDLASNHKLLEELRTMFRPVNASLGLWPGTGRGPLSLDDHLAEVADDLLEVTGDGAGAGNPSPVTLEPPVPPPDLDQLTEELAR